MSTLIEIMVMIFLGTKHGHTDIFRFYSDNPGLSLHCFRIFIFVYMYLSITLADIFGLQLSRTDILGLAERSSD